MPASLTAVDALGGMKGAAVTSLAVVVAFGATLLIGGRMLGAWGDPGKELVAPPVRELPQLRPLPKAKARAVSSDWTRWVESANAHCDRVVTDIATLETPKTFAEAQTYLQRFWQLNKDWTGTLAALPTPRGFAPQIAKLRRLSTHYSVLVDRMLAAARGGDSAAYSAAITDMAGTVTAEVDVLARLGAEGCVAATHT